MARRRPAGSESAGYHFNATPKRPTRTRTPVKAPPKALAAKGPAGDYAGSAKDFAAAVAALPAPARKVTQAATRQATRAASRRRRAAARERQVGDAVLASVNAGRRQRQARRYEPDPAKAIISSRPNPLAEPDKFSGKATAGTPTRAELQRVQREGTLKVNKKGFVTTPAVRTAAGELQRAQRAARRSGPDLSGLSPAEREVARLAGKAHRRYPDVPVPLAMAQVKQESGFNAGAVSSAGAQGLTQFIPSTAASYGVKYGTGKKEKRSQVLGQFHLMHDEGVGTNPTLALNNYLGLHGQTTPSDYSSNILAMSKDYRGLGKPGASPKVRRQLARAQQAARQVGLKGGSAFPAGPPPPKLVKRVVVAEHAMREVEGTPYVWGGGHASFGSFNPRAGLDCSGSVSWVIHKVAPNLLKEPLTSGSMGSVLEPGPGALTVFYNDEHTFLRLINRRGEAVYWGTSVDDAGAGGLTRHDAPSRDYLTQYNVGHVPGMGRKQALQLGAEQGAFTGTYAGMTISSDGSTATIAPSSGGKPGGVVKGGKPGFSRRPIRPTALQRFNRNKRKLARLGVPLGGDPKGGASETHPVLQELIEKYGSASPVPTTAAERKAKALAAARS